MKLFVRIQDGAAERAQPCIHVGKFARFGGDLRADIIGKSLGVLQHVLCLRDLLLRRLEQAAGDFLAEAQKIIRL